MCLAIALSATLCLAAGLTGASPSKSLGLPPRSAVAAERDRGPTSNATTLSMDMRRGESLSATLSRGGLGATEAGRAAAALADAFDVVNPHPGLRLLVSIARMDGPTAQRRLVSMFLTPRDDDHLGLSREADGALHLRRVETPVFVTPKLIRGVVHGSLYLSMVEAGVASDTAAKVTDLFGRRLDLARDVATGAPFRLVFDERRRADGQRVGADELLYAEVGDHGGAARLYRFQPEGAAEPRMARRRRPARNQIPAAHAGGGRPADDFRLRTAAASSSRFHPHA